MIAFTRRQPAINFKYFDFLNRETLVDVTIIADGHVMQAHKVVLAAASSYFEDIFALIPDKHPAIVLSDVTQGQLTNLMEYIYCGRVELHESEVARFRRLMQTLKIEAKLESDCENTAPATATAISTTNNNSSNEVDLLEEITIKEEEEEEEVEAEDEPMEDEGGYTSGDSGDFRLPLALMSQELSVRVRPARAPPRNTNKPRVTLNNVVRNESAKLFMHMNPQLCPFCQKVSKSNKHRNEHVKYCVRNPDRIVSKCPHCDKSFCDPYYVRKHMKTIHGDDGGSAVVTRASNGGL